MTVGDLAKIAKKVDPERRVKKVLADNQKKAAEKKRGIVIPPNTPVLTFSPLDPLRQRPDWQEYERDPEYWHRRAKRHEARWFSNTWDEADMEYHANVRFGG